jgi:hypothetical protein
MRRLAEADKKPKSPRPATPAPVVREQRSDAGGVPSTVAGFLERLRQVGQTKDYHVR